MARPLPILTCLALLGACDTARDTGGADTDADTDADADTDIPTEPSFVFTVGPGSDLAGSYAYAVDVTCELKWEYYQLTAWETTASIPQILGQTPII
jgi:hypothetical protein